MKSFLAIAALLLVAGCSGASSGPNTVNNQITPKQTRVETQARHGAHMPNLTQASSISNAPGKLSVKMNQPSNGDGSNWLDLFKGITTPVQQPTNQPVNPQQPVNGVAPENPRQPVNGVQPENPRQPVNGGRPVTPEKPVKQQPSGNSSQDEQQVLELVNQARTSAGLKALTLNSSLSKVAMAKAQDMINNNYFDHQSPTYGSPFDMMKSFGITYNAAGENIAKGQTSPREVMNQWMNSEGHRANILNSSFNQIGIAYFNGGWVQEFTD
ncbi:CAP domain-containing protein [Paenibacillus sp. GCM10027626]|uniref:CAP domain-containing protein n=1 Tax=Paenibacillus sp. GCM10027626 TaxID=3273411 RepID=UPI0036419B95